MTKAKKTKVDKVFDRVLKDKRFRQEVVRKRLEFFFPVYFHKYLKYETAPFHKEIFGILEDESNKLAVIVAFRGSAKSTIITTAYVLWSILGRQQKKFIVILGQTEQKARQYLMNIKAELEHNDLLKKDLGPFDEERNQWGATALIVRKLNAKIMISSSEQSIRGMRHGEHRPDLIILDDVEDTASVKTQEGRDKAFDWFAGEVIPAGDRNTRIIAVGNLLHEDSLLKRLEQRIVDGEVSGVYREYPIIDENNVPLWPGKYPTFEHVEEERRKIASPVSWAREFLLKIISTDEQVVHPEWIHTYTDLPAEDLNTVAIGIDLAISEKASADCTAMVVGYIYGYGSNMKIYIQPHPVNERLTFPAQVDRIKALDAIHGQKCSRVKFYIEDVAYQKALVQLLEQNKYDVEAAPTRGSDKAARLRLATPMMKDARVFFPAEGSSALIGQLLGFGKEKHDDLADAFAYLVINTLEKTRPLATAGTWARPAWMDRPLPVRNSMFPAGNRPWSDL